jgi:uncharacterized metal-binding protein
VALVALKIGMDIILHNRSHAPHSQAAQRHRMPRESSG